MRPEDALLFDAHCHLDPAAPEDAPGGPALAGRMLCGVGPGDWPRLRRVAAAWPGTVAAYGLHPWHIATAAGDWPEQLENFLLADPRAWLGEAGLDGLKTETASPDRQTEVLSVQLSLAARLGRGVNLHCVKAWEPLLACLDSRYLSRGGGRVVVHAFGGPHQYIKPLAERGVWFTVGPLAWRNGSDRARRRIAALPPERILVESDAFLAPGADDAEGVAATAEWVAGIFGVGAGEMAERLAGNARRVFGDG